MKILFSALHFANLRNYESVVRLLAERGHRVHLIAEEPETFGGQALVERLAAEHPTVSWGWAPSPSEEPWFSFAQKVRFALEYVRFLGPEYAQAQKLRMRNIMRVPRVVRWVCAGIGWTGIGQRAILRVLKWLERHIPLSRDVEAFLAAQRPDVLLLTSLTVARSTEVHQLKAARALGIRSAACILSWDHLSSKALLHIAPDRTLVWNDTQKTEAVHLHGLPAESIAVTGAQCYDQWFDRRPGRTREEFCASVGLDPARRFVLYVCSAMSPLPNPLEPVFVRDWVQALRASEDSEVREAALLIRPHPEREREWRGIDLDGFENVVVSGRTPIDSDAKADYFDALFYSDAVVGLCTSAFLEAAIVGRPVLTLLLPAFRLHQEGMAHFRYLLTVGGGLLHTAPDLDAHIGQLGTAMRGRGARDERNQRFLQEFIRPRGLTVPATPSFVDAVESLVEHPQPRSAPSTAPASAEARVRRLAAMTVSGLGAWLMMDLIEAGRAKSGRELAVLKGELIAAQQAYRRAKLERARQVAREKEGQQRSKSWARWRRGLSARKLLARFAGSMKQMFDARQP